MNNVTISGDYSLSYSKSIDEDSILEFYMDSGSQLNVSIVGHDFQATFYLDKSDLPDLHTFLGRLLDE